MAQWTEYHVKTIDMHGDAIDSCIWDKLREARADYARTVDVYAEIPEVTRAIVLEKVTHYTREGAETRFVVLAESGSAQALAAWRG